MELTTHLLKSKIFYNQIKILYPIWGVQSNLENKRHIISIHIHSNEQITINHNYNHCIEIHSIEEIKTSHSFIPFGHGMNKTILQNRVSVT